jgi:hypothetical protein
MHFVEPPPAGRQPSNETGTCVGADSGAGPDDSRMRVRGDSRRRLNGDFRQGIWMVFDSAPASLSSTEILANMHLDVALYGRLVRRNLGGSHDERRWQRHLRRRLAGRQLRQSQPRQHVVDQAIQRFGQTRSRSRTATCSSRSGGAILSCCVAKRRWMDDNLFVGRLARLALEITAMVATAFGSRSISLRGITASKRPRS